MACMHRTPMHSLCMPGCRFAAVVSGRVGGAIGTPHPPGRIFVRGVSVVYIELTSNADSDRSYMGIHDTSQ